MNTFVHERVNNQILRKLEKLAEATNNQIKAYFLDGAEFDLADYVENNSLPVIWFDAKGEVIYSNKSMNNLMKSKVKGTNIQDKCAISQLANKDGETVAIYDEEGQLHKFRVYSKTCECQNRRVNQCLLLPTA